MSKRSPRYPRQNLSKSLEMVKKLFDGAHQSKLDVDTAAKVIGYSNSAGGAASSALGALRQFGLVDGLRGDMGVSDLAMRILEPMDDNERVSALHEAAMKPEMFEKIVNHFGGKLPPLDEPIRAFLIRQESFSASGANELVSALRDTMSFLPPLKEANLSFAASSGKAQEDSAEVDDHVAEADDVSGRSGYKPPAGPHDSELITLPLGLDCRAELRLVGKVTASAYGRLIRHLELMRDIAEEDGKAADD